MTPLSRIVMSARFMYAADQIALGDLRFREKQNGSRRQGKGLRPAIPRGRFRRPRTAAIISTTRLTRSVYPLYISG